MTKGPYLSDLAPLNKHALEEYRRHLPKCPLLQLKTPTGFPGADPVTALQGRRSFPGRLRHDKEMQLAENEMPGLMAVREKYGPDSRSKG
jgi:hypothetical protein